MEANITQQQTDNTLDRPESRDPEHYLNLWAQRTLEAVKDRRWNHAACYARMTEAYADELVQKYGGIR